MSVLMEQITLLREFLRTGFRKITLFCAVGFLAAGVIGCVVGLLYPDVVTSTIASFWEAIEEAGVIREDGSLSTVALLANNWTAMLLSAAYGFIPFLFLPVTSLVSNGFILGITGAMYQLYDQTLALWLAALLPHGIFELTALVLSIASGIHLCISMSRLVLGSPNRVPMVETLCSLLRVMLLLVAPLTIAAAFIEAYITPWVMTFFM